MPKIELVCGTLHTATSIGFAHTKMHFKYIQVKAKHKEKRILTGGEE